MASVSVWARERLGDLVDLTDHALPAENLTGDELLGCCWDDGGVVLGFDDASGVVAAVARPLGASTVAWVKLAVVHPEVQRTGCGTRLMTAAEAWAFDAGASRIELGGSAPFYLWPGVDVAMLGMLCLAESGGYDPTGAELNMSLATTFRAPVPEELALRRPLDDADLRALEAFVGDHWPWWVPEVERGVDQGGCHAAFDAATGQALGFACHSVNRAGWIGPMGTDPSRRQTGLGSALLSAVSRDLMAAGISRAEVAWVGPVGFYAKAGATVSRTFRTFRKPRP